MVVRELLRLLVHRVGHFPAAVADVHAVQAGERVDIALALMVLDADTLAAAHDLAGQRAGFVVVRVRRRMHEVGTVLAQQRVDGLRHDELL